MLGPAGAGGARGRGRQEGLVLSFVFVADGFCGLWLWRFDAGGREEREGRAAERKGSQAL